MKKRRDLILSIVFLVVMLIITYLPVAILTVYSFTDAKTIGVWNFSMFVTLLNCIKNCSATKRYSAR